MEYSTRQTLPNRAEFTANPNRTADQLFDKYLIPPINIVAEQDNITVYLIYYPHNVSLYIKPNTILVSLPLSGKIERNEFISRIQQAIASREQFELNGELFTTKPE